MSFTITDDKERPLFIGREPVVIGRVEVLPPDPPMRVFARETIEKAKRIAAKGTVLERAMKRINFRGK